MSEPGSTDDAPTPRFCREAQAQLPFLVSGELTGWGARVVRAHVKRCRDCAAELARQEQLTAALTSMRDTPPEPPPGLLDDLQRLSEATNAAMPKGRNFH